MSGSVKHQTKPMCKASSGTGQGQGQRPVTTFSTASRARPPGAPAVPAEPIPGMTRGRGDRAERGYGRRSQADAAQAAGPPPVAGAGSPARCLRACGSARRGQLPPPTGMPPTGRPTRPAATSPRQRGKPGRARVLQRPRSCNRAKITVKVVRPRFAAALHLDGDLVRLESAPIRRTGGESGCVPQACHAGGQQRVLRVAHAQSKRRLTC
jgi:hypothetical protein